MIFNESNLDLNQMLLKFAQEDGRLRLNPPGSAYLCLICVVGGFSFCGGLFYGIIHFNDRE